MEKICKMCGMKFQCSGNEECWCNKIKLSQKKLSVLNGLDDDCFCENCLLEAP